MFDAIELLSNCQTSDKSYEVIRIDFCNLLIEELKKMKGEDLEPCLSDMTFHKKEQCVDITFRFSL